jgi:hypothetical protein
MPTSWVVVLCPTELSWRSDNPQPSSGSLGWVSRCPITEFRMLRYTARGKRLPDLHVSVTSDTKVSICGGRQKTCEQHLELGEFI